MAPGWNGDPWALNSGLRTPRLPATHAEAGTVLAHGTGNYTFDISRTSFGEFRSPQATSCRTTWFNQEACTGVWTITAFGNAADSRSAAFLPRWEEPLSTIQNTRLALA